MVQLSAADQANDQMVDRLIAQGALWSPALIAAFRATPRHRFLDHVYRYHDRSERWRQVRTRDSGPEELKLVYSDRALITRLSGGTSAVPPVPISSSSQPSLMAQMLEDLQLQPGQSVLEIGAGTGYNAALLAFLSAPGQVWSIDVDREVLAEAWDHLHAFPDRHVELRHADGRQGFGHAAPFDRIMVTAATQDLEPAWLEQLAVGGVLVAPLALAPGLAFVVRGSLTKGVFQGRLTRAAYFMPLRGEGEIGAAFVEPLPSAGFLRRVPAPWTDWFERRRPRMGWLGFIQALAFLGLLRGLQVFYQMLDDGHPTYGVGAPDGTALCWLGETSWQINGDAGQALGETLLRSFLDAGGPWPTEFRLRTCPGSNLASGDGPQVYHRQGPHCRQVWELSEPRERLAWL